MSSLSYFSIIFSLNLHDIPYDLYFTRFFTIFFTVASYIFNPRYSSQTLSVVLRYSGIRLLHDIPQTRTPLIHYDIPRLYDIPHEHTP